MRMAFPGAIHPSFPHIRRPPPPPPPLAPRTRSSTVQRGAFTVPKAPNVPQASGNLKGGRAQQVLGITGVGSPAVLQVKLRVMEQHYKQRHLRRFSASGWRHQHSGDGDRIRV